MSNVAILLSEKLFECALLKQQLAERDALILELSDKVDFYANTSNEFKERYGDIGGKLARTPLKNQKILDEIKGRV